MEKQAARDLDGWRRDLEGWRKDLESGKIEKQKCWRDERRDLEG